MTATFDHVQDVPCDRNGKSNAIDSWRRLPANQQPEWPNEAALRQVTRKLSGLPPLVFPEECDRLKERLASVARGEAFLLQGGDCVETFDGATAESVHGTLSTLLQMAVLLTYAASAPVVKIARVAGQYCKPRSVSTETCDGITLPVYRGDGVNGFAFTQSARIPDPTRLWQMYKSSGETLKLVRDFAAAARGDLHQVHAWNRRFAEGSSAGSRCGRLVEDIDRALHFMRANGVSGRLLPEVELFASHEGLILDYESALTRSDPRTRRRYATSGHMIWIGDRTRDLDGAHIDYFSKVSNPIGVKLGPSVTARTVRALVDKLDPLREPGRLTFIARMGATMVGERLPELVESVGASGAQVVWVCDPMHGNTFEAPTGHKTRRFDDVLSEVEGFFEVHRTLGTHAGGLHIELTGDDVTECVGGADGIEFHDLHTRYESLCDPRLNRRQSLELAFLVADMISSGRR